MIQISCSTHKKLICENDESMAMLMLPHFDTKLIFHMLLVMFLCLNPKLCVKSLVLLMNEFLCFRVILYIVEE